MTLVPRDRILRNYHRMGPTKFHSFVQRVAKSLRENQKRIPESTWAGSPSLLPTFFELYDKHDAAFHEATFRSILAIADRDVLQGQLVICLDEIASLLEAAAVRSPDILISTGFDLAKERRSSTRTKVAMVAVAPTGEHQGDAQ